MSFADNLRRIRKARGYTIQELAFLAGLSDDCVYQLEKNMRSPMLATADKIANALNVPIDALVRKE